jgi:DNA mismatch repair protein MutS
MLYRMGDFYETFLEDAITTARLLAITLTGREAGKLGKVPMAGVPVRSLDTYLNKLLALNVKVAICEQMEDPALAKGLVDRSVVRIVSAGTVTEAQQLNPQESAYLVALVLPKQTAMAPKPTDPCALAVIDLASGVFNTVALGYSQLLAELHRLAPKEILVAGHQKASGIVGIAGNREGLCPAIITQTWSVTPLPAEAFDWAVTQPMLLALLNVKTVEGFGLALANDLSSMQCALACGAISHYLRYSFIEHPPKFNGIQRYYSADTVQLSASARANLELLSTLRDSRKEGSLLGVLHHTQTPMGSRLLRQWVGAPSTQLPEIESRLDGVEELLNQPALLQTVRQLLAGLYDVERLATRLLNLTILPKELLNLSYSLKVLPQLSQPLQETTKSFYLLRLQGFPSGVSELTSLVDKMMHPEPSAGLKEGGLIAKGYNHQLDALITTLETQQEWLTQYEALQRDATGIKTLKVGVSSTFGYYLEVSKGQAGQVPVAYQRKQTLANAERFITPELQAFETQVQQAHLQRVSLEYELFVALRTELQSLAPVIQEVGHRIASLDVLQAFAWVAKQRGYVRPVLVEASGASAGLVLDIVVRGSIASRAVCG